MTRSTRRELAYQLLAAILFVSALAIVHASGETGMNDDWSFIYTVRQLAKTGHLEYNGWSAPLIGFQAYWAALFVRLFGFSFFIVRASSYLLTLCAIPILWNLLHSVTSNEKQAFFGLLAFLFSPVTLPNLATFMTDMPAFFLFAAALLAALKAWESKENRQAFWWLAAATICSILSGSVRQIYWLGGVCLLATLGIFRMRSLSGRLFVAACGALTLAAGAAGSFWLAHQPYIPADISAQTWHESSWSDIAYLAALPLLRDLVGLTVLCLPLSAPLAYFQAKRSPLWCHLLIIPAAAALSYWLANPMPWAGNTITNFGVIANGMLSLGDRPQVLPLSVMLLLATSGLASAAYVIGGAFQLKLKAESLVRLCILTIPFLSLYLLIIALRAPAFGIFDRYLIPHFFVAILILLALSARQRTNIGILASLLLTVFSLYAMATTNDYFAEARAKLQAAQELLSAGHPRDSILDGFEFDSWTQVEQTGHLNNQLLKFPPDAYVQHDDCNGPDDTQAWWRSMTPVLKARYIVTLTPLQGLQPTKFPDISYRRWLPWGRYYVYIQQVPPTDPPLTCKIGSSE